MPFRVSGKNLDLGEALRERINARIAQAVSKYFDGGYSGHVTLAKDGFGIRTECAIHLNSKITLHTEGMAPDAYASADQAALRIEKRLRRYHRQLKEHRHERGETGTSSSAATYVIEAPQHDDAVDLDSFTPVIIAEIDDDLETPLGQRGGDRTRHDRRAGPGLSSRRPRWNKRGLPATGRPFRLDRSRGSLTPRCPLTRSRVVPMVRGL